MRTEYWRANLTHTHIQPYGTSMIKWKRLHGIFLISISFGRCYSGICPCDEILYNIEWNIEDRNIYYALGWEWWNKFTDAWVRVWFLHMHSRILVLELHAILLCMPVCVCVCWFVLCSCVEHARVHGRKLSKTGNEHFLRSLFMVFS